MPSTTFDRTLFENTLDQLEEQLIPLYHFPILASTNLTIRELLDQGEKPPLVVIAEEQTAGRGQWGRTWVSEKGGLYLSLALEELGKTVNCQQSALQLTLATAWGLTQKLRDHGIPVLLKWPNDLILTGRKVGGIKTETKHHQGKMTQAIVGVGLNFANPTPAPGLNLTTWLQEIPNPPPLSLEILAAIAVNGILSGDRYYQTKGAEALLQAYWELSQSQGRSVQVQGCAGVVVGLTVEGLLRVRLRSPGASTEICCLPGEISLGYD